MIPALMSLFGSAAGSAVGQGGMSSTAGLMSNPKGMGLWDMVNASYDNRDALSEFKQPQQLPSAKGVDPALLQEGLMSAAPQMQPLPPVQQQQFIPAGLMDFNRDIYSQNLYDPYASMRY